MHKKVEHTTVQQNINTWISEINVDHKMALSVDIVLLGYTEADLNIALIPCNMPPYENQHSLVGDIVRSTENLNQAARRVIKDRVGIKDLYIEQVEAFSSVDRHPLGRVVTIAYYSLIKLDQEVRSNQHPDLVWKNIDEVDTLAFDHKEILDTCLEKLRTQMREEPVGFNLLPKKFTLKQLQELYEVVLKMHFDKRNFRRKLKNLNILQDVEELQTEVSHRPAKLYSFNKELYNEKKLNGLLF